MNILHQVLLFESPAKASDGGYKASDFKKVDERFGKLKDLQSVRDQMESKSMFLMLDIVLHHTSDQYAWAIKAMSVDTNYKNYGIKKAYFHFIIHIFN